MGDYDKMNGGVVTEIIDDGPKWKAIIILAIAGALVLVGLVVVILLMYQVPARAAQAVDNNRMIGAELMADKVLAWRMFIYGMAGASLALPFIVWFYAIGLAIRTLQAAGPFLYRLNIKELPYETTTDLALRNHQATRIEGPTGQRQSSGRYLPGSLRNGTRSGLGK